MQSMAGLLIPVIFIGLALAGISIMALAVRRYTKCAPNEVLVVYGRRHKERLADPVTGEMKTVERGYRLIRGGAAFVLPVLEALRKVELDTFQVPFSVEDTPNVDGVLVSVDALANMKVSSDPALLNNAVERLLSHTQKQLETTATDTLSGLLRQIVGTLTVEEIIKDREKIAGQVLDAAVTELGKLGFQLDNFVIQKINDSEGYIDALGKKRTAEVKRDATIAQADAQREADVQSAAFRREGETAKANADEEISNAQRQRDQVMAKNEATVKAEQARIEVRANTAEAEESKALKVARVAALEAEVQARTRLQEEERKRKDAELRASVIVTAEREKEAKIIRADADAEAAVKTGEALRIREEKAGQGIQARLTAEAEGRKAAANALQKEKEAEAAGEQAKLLAQAAGRKAQGEAEGSATLATLTAEAVGFEKKNKALADLSDGARLIMILEKLPIVIQEVGEAGERVVGSAFEHVGQGLSKIDSVHVLDMGGSGSGHGNGSVADFALTVPKIVFRTLAELQTLGVNPQELMKKVGVDTSMITNLFGGALGASGEKRTEDQPH